MGLIIPGMSLLPTANAAAAVFNVVIRDLPLPLLVM